MVAGGGGTDAILSALPASNVVKDKEIAMLKQCFELSVASNGFGLTVDYMILKDVTNKLDLDTLLVLPVMKTAVAEISGR